MLVHTARLCRALFASVALKRFAFLSARIPRPPTPAAAGAPRFSVLTSAARSMRTSLLREPAACPCCGRIPAPSTRATRPACTTTATGCAAAALSSAFPKMLRRWLVPRTQPRRGLVLVRRLGAAPHPTARRARMGRIITVGAEGAAAEEAAGAVESPRTTVAEILALAAAAATQGLSNVCRSPIRLSVILLGRPFLRCEATPRCRARTG